MTIEVKSVSAEEQAIILGLVEGHYLDFKRKEIKPGKLSETISAFANASGGEVYLGIAEQATGGTRGHRWDGFDEPEQANAHIQVLESLGALGNHYQAAFLYGGETAGYVLHILAPKTKSILNASDGHAYIRRNAQNLRVDTDEGLKRLSLDKGVVTFEDETVAVPLDVITNSSAVIEFVLGVVPSAEPDPWLRSQFLIEKDRPTVAGILLYSDMPQAALPKRSE